MFSLTKACWNFVGWSLTVGIFPRGNFHLAVGVMFEICYINSKIKHITIDNYWHMWRKSYFDINGEPSPATHNTNNIYIRSIDNNVGELNSMLIYEKKNFRNKTRQNYVSEYKQESMILCFHYPRAGICDFNRMRYVSSILGGKVYKFITLTYNVEWKQST